MADDVRQEHFQGNPQQPFESSSHKRSHKHKEGISVSFFFVVGSRSQVVEIAVSSSPIPPGLLLLLLFIAGKGGGQPFKVLDSSTEGL